MELTGQPQGAASDQYAVALAVAHFYDERGGGVEAEFKEDKDGLGLTSRNKKSFWGQVMLVQLGALAHNVLIWAREWLKAAQPKLASYGLKRLVRDLMTISGLICYSDTGRAERIVLNRSDPYAGLMARALAFLLLSQMVTVEAAQT